MKGDEVMKAEHEDLNTVNRKREVQSSRVYGDLKYARGECAESCQR